MSSSTRVALNQLTKFTPSLGGEKSFFGVAKSFFHSLTPTFVTRYLSTRILWHEACKWPALMTKQTSILLIEDDLMVRQALGQALAVENYHVVPAANRHEALREVGQRQIDIVLLDLNPRGENG